jgi:HAD superfamily hydrolase (TIGR01459 family)
MALADTRIACGIEELLPRYDGFLIDQFGVLHDGERALPGALEALRLIAQAEKPVVLLSNSGRRSRPNEERLAGMRIGRELYSAMITSGETAWLGLEAQDDPLFQGLGERALVFCRESDHSATDGLDLEIVARPKDATFVLMSGIDADEAAQADCRRLLAEAGRIGLPMLCTNPDTVSIEGSRHYDGPGAFAARYADAGGEVRYVGKPWPAIYTVALETLERPADRVVAIGDSLDHDVAGAAGMEIDSALITGGVHRDELGDLEGDALLERLDRLAGERSRPTWVMAAFRPEAGGARDVD